MLYISFVKNEIYQIGQQFSKVYLESCRQKSQHVYEA